MNKTQTKKITQAVRRKAREIRYAVEIDYVKRAKEMAFKDRLALAWIILKG